MPIQNAVPNQGQAALVVTESGSLDHPTKIDEGRMCASTGMYCMTKNETIVKYDLAGELVQYRVVVGRCSTKQNMKFCQITDGSAPNIAESSCICGSSICDNETAVTVMRNRPRAVKIK